MLTAVIPLAETPEQTAERINHVVSKAECIELRLDYPFGYPPDYREIAFLRRQFPIPMIFTLRKASQGGLWRSDEEHRLETLFELANLQPEFIDIEYDVPRDFSIQLKAKYPNTKMICSWHDFSHTAADLEAMLTQMQHPCFDAYKIATLAQSSDDALRMLAFVASHHTHCTLTGISMSEKGRLSRVLSRIAGNAFHYVALGEICTTLPGQLTIDESLTFLKA